MGWLLTQIKCIGEGTQMISDVLVLVGAATKIYVEEGLFLIVYLEGCKNVISFISKV